MNSILHSWKHHRFSIIRIQYDVLLTLCQRCLIMEHTQLCSMVWYPDAEHCYPKWATHYVNISVRRTHAHTLNFSQWVRIHQDALPSHGIRKFIGAQKGRRAQLGILFVLKKNYCRALRRHPGLITYLRNNIILSNMLEPQGECKGALSCRVISKDTRERKVRDAFPVIPAPHSRKSQIWNQKQEHLLSVWKWRLAQDEVITTERVI